jgi:hypothetical protein
MSKFVLTALLVILATAPVIGVRQGPPGDLDVRTTRDLSTDDTLTTLTLLLKGPNGPLPINLAVTTRKKVRVTSGPAVEVRLDFAMPLFTGVLDFKRPHAVFRLDKDTKEEVSLELSADGAAMLLEDRNPNLSLASDLAMLGRFAKAVTIEGRVFGVAFVLTPQQVKAIVDFAARR